MGDLRTVPAGSGDLDEVRRLVAQGHDVNYQECEDVDGADASVVAQRGWTALMIAAMHGHLEVVRFLVGAGARLDTQTSSGDTALTLASRAERPQSVELLRELGASR